jgi:hypothetical protein
MAEMAMAYAIPCLVQLHTQQGNTGLPSPSPRLPMHANGRTDRQDRQRAGTCCCTTTVLHYLTVESARGPDAALCDKHARRVPSALDGEGVQRLGLSLDLCLFAYVCATYASVHLAVLILTKERKHIPAASSVGTRRPRIPLA